MSVPIEFFFDFSSPYGYLASAGIDALAARHDRQVRWRPYLMGAVMKLTGSTPLVSRPMIDAYSLHDMNRSARLLGVPFGVPSPFPVATVAACRAFYWLAPSDAARAQALAAALYRAYFVDGRDIGEAGVVLDVVVEEGHDRAVAEGALRDPAVKQRLKTATEEAMEVGVFGSPFFIVDGEPFWGHDRMHHLETWLETGGW